MAWNNSGKGAGEGFKEKFDVRTEEITSYESRAVWSSEINWIPPGKDFQIIANTAATNLSASAHVELWVAYSSGAAAASRYRIRDAAGEDFTDGNAAIDNATFGPTMHDISTYGEFPYYYLKLNTGGGSVTCAIIVGQTRQFNASVG